MQKMLLEKSTRVAWAALEDFGQYKVHGLIGFLIAYVAVMTHYCRIFGLREMAELLIFLSILLHDLWSKYSGLKTYPLESFVL